MLVKGKAIISIAIIFGMAILPGKGETTKITKGQTIERSFSIEQQVDTEIKEAKDQSDWLILDKGIVNQRYRLNFEADYAMLSRDGSECQRVTNGELINLPGTYFLTTTKEQSFKITKLTIKPNDWKDTWKIQAEEELDEILKAALEGFRRAFSIQFDYGDFTIEEINEVLFEHIQKLLETYPKLTFESYTIRGVPGSNPTISIEINYPLQDIEKLKEYDSVIGDRIMEILTREVKGNLEDYDREWALFENMIQSTKYERELINREINGRNNGMVHTLFGTLVDGKAVCDGYAKSMMYLLNAVGVPTRLIFGEAEGIPHVWNRVNIQGKYYHLDATWGDLEEKQFGGFYDYFNETDKYMLKTHEWEEALSVMGKEEKYSLAYLPGEIEGVDKIDSKEQWSKVLGNIQRNNIEEQSLIFYNQVKNNWDTRELIGELCNTLGKSIEYNIVEKYDMLIINYKIYP